MIYSTPDHATGAR